MRKALVNIAQANDLESGHLFKRMYFFSGLSSEDLGSLAELSGSEALDELKTSSVCTLRTTQEGKENNWLWQQQ